MAQKSKILVIGATGYIGRCIVQASAKLEHPTFALVRESTASNPDKAQLIDKFKSLNVTILYGDLYNHESLVNAIKQVDVVISAVGAPELADQVNIIAAIKEAGNVKRFLPAEFGVDVDRVESVEPVGSVFATKIKIRRTIEAEGIPYTYVICNGFAGFYLPTLGQYTSTAPPRDKVVILGDGNAKVIFLVEEDIATYTIKAVDDPRTLNKILYMRPPANTVSFNDLVSIWESKIGKSLEKTYVSEEELLKNIEETPMPLKALLAVYHGLFVKGISCNYEIDTSVSVETTNLYPEVKYITVDEYLQRFV